MNMPAKLALWGVVECVCKCSDDFDVCGLIWPTIPWLTTAAQTQNKNENNWCIFFMSVSQKPQRHFNLHLCFLQTILSKEMYTALKAYIFFSSIILALLAPCSTAWASGKNTKTKHLKFEKKKKIYFKL